MSAGEHYSAIVNQPMLVLCEHGHSVYTSDPDYEVCTAALTPDGRPYVTADAVPANHPNRCGGRILEDEEVHDLARRALGIGPSDG